MSDKKKYLINLFLKCSKHLFSAQYNLEINESFLRGAYLTVPEDDFKNVMAEHGVEEYVDKISLVIDSMFTLEEIQELNAFFTSPIGRKITDKKYLLKMQKIREEIVSEREEKLSKIGK
jgi:hypothetical protein